MKNSKKLVILFDGSCRFCTAIAELLRVLDWRHRLHCLPFQAPGIPQANGLTLADCERILWAVSPGGSSIQVRWIDLLMQEIRMSSNVRVVSTPQVVNELKSHGILNGRERN